MLGETGESQETVNLRHLVTPENKRYTELTCSVREHDVMTRRLRVR